MHSSGAEIAYQQMAARWVVDSARRRNYCIVPGCISFQASDHGVKLHRVPWHKQSAAQQWARQLLRHGTPRHKLTATGRVCSAHFAGGKTARDDVPTIFPVMATGVGVQPSMHPAVCTVSSLHSAQVTPSLQTITPGHPGQGTSQQSAQMQNQAALMESENPEHSERASAMAQEQTAHGFEGDLVGCVVKTEPCCDADVAVTEARQGAGDLARADRSGVSHDGNGVHFVCVPSVPIVIVPIKTENDLLERDAEDGASHSIAPECERKEEPGDNLVPKQEIQSHSDIASCQSFKTPSQAGLQREAVDLTQSRMPIVSLGTSPPKSALLTAHNRNHTGERPYQCTLCSRSFKYAGSLKTHTNTHTGEKPHQRGMCAKFVAGSKALNGEEISDQQMANGSVVVSARRRNFCIVPGCVSYQDRGVKLHRVPWHKQSVARQWTSRLLRHGTPRHKLTATGRVCSAHFAGGKTARDDVPTIFPVMAAGVGVQPSMHPAVCTVSSLHSAQVTPSLQTITPGHPGQGTSQQEQTAHGFEGDLAGCVVKTEPCCDADVAVNEARQGAGDLARADRSGVGHDGNGVHFVCVPSVVVEDPIVIVPIKIENDLLERDAEDGASHGIAPECDRKEEPGDNLVPKQEIQPHSDIASCQSYKTPSQGGLQREAGDLTQSRLPIVSLGTDLPQGIVMGVTADEVHDTESTSGTHCASEHRDPLQCIVCSKICSRAGQVRVHMRTHTGEKPYECSVCSKAFARAHSLKNHVRTHTGEKPYKCSLCSKSYAQSAHLSAHKRNHTGERPYQCTLCSRSFKYAGSLEAHTNAHTGEKPHQCGMCAKSFAGSKALKAHLNTHTDGQLIQPSEQSLIVTINPATLFSLL